MHINALLRVSMLGVELKRLWVRNFKSLRDFSLDIKSKFTAVTGPSGSGKTSLVEVFELWRDVVEHARGNAPNPFLKWWSFENAVWRGDVSQPIALGLELVAGDVRVRYELELYGRGADERVEVERGGARLEYSDGVLRPGGDALHRVLLPAVCVGERIPAKTDGARLLLDAVSAVCQLAGRFVVLKELNWTELRRPKRLEKQTRLLPDASNLAPLLLQLTGGRPTPQVKETLRRLGYASISFPVAEDGRIYIKLTRPDGTAIAQPAIPTGVFKALALEVALMLRPTLVAADGFECGLDEDLQLYMLDRLANSDAYVFVATTSRRVLERAKSLGTLVELRLEGGETKTATQLL
jgi:predicted ATPase